MRTKEQIIDILADRKVNQKLSESKWSDLVNSVQALSVPQRNKLVARLTENDPKDAGIILFNALFEDAKERARADIETMLADDSLTLAELDTLI